MSQNGHKVRIGKLSEFRPQTVNANKHTERGLRMLDDAMSEDGYVAPMTAVADAEIIDGSARLERAFDKFNDEAIILEHDGKRPIITVRTDIPNASTKEAKRIAVRANRIAEVDLSWDPEVLQSLEPAELEGMFSDKELAEILTQTGIEPKDAEPQIDKAEELRQKWGTETGQLWVIGNHRLLVGDATNKADVGRLCGNVGASLSIADPPYNVGYEYESIDDKMQAANYGRWCAAFLVLMKAHSDMQIVTPGKTNERLYEPDEWLTWFKGFGLSRGHYFKAMVTEPVLLFGKKPTGKFYATDHFDFPTDREQGLRDLHTCPKPLGLWSALIEPMTERANVVYDPFVGSGTTLVAAENLNRKCYAIEISPAYVAVCLERMTTAFPNLKIEKVDQARAA